MYTPAPDQLGHVEQRSVAAGIAEAFGLQPVPLTQIPQPQRMLRPQRDWQQPVGASFLASHAGMLSQPAAAGKTHKG
jgi:hypothetical protein